MRLMKWLAIVGLTLLGMSPAFAADIDWNAVDAALGRKAAVLPGDVHRFGMPRSDLDVVRGDVTVRPALALGSWAAFHAIGDGQAIVMGDLVLKEDEIAAVMDALSEGGVAVTALHNHLTGESPKVMFLHMGGRGDPVAMARAIKAALDRTGTPAPGAAGAMLQAAIDLDVDAIQQALGHQGSVSGGILHIGVPLAESVTVDGVTVPPTMGTGTAINFQPLSDGRAVVYGDFALTGGEVGSVISILRRAGIEVMALHNHMLGDQPRLFYMHFWGEDDAVTLAGALRAALESAN